MATEIPLTRGLVAVVDDADAEVLSQFSWFARPGRSIMYAGRRNGRGLEYMHRFLLDPGPGVFVDHVDGDGLNNRRSNIRVCDLQGNARNRRKLAPTSSRFKGVHFAQGSWVVGIKVDGEQINLGRFQSEVQAALQYDRAARLMFGKFAKTNESMGFFEGIDLKAQCKPVKAKPIVSPREERWQSEMARLGINPRVA
jgi:hypothetical protein